MIICGRKFEILHLLSQPKLDAKITVVHIKSFRLGLHHMDNIVNNNGPRKTEDNYQEIDGAAREILTASLLFILKKKHKSIVTTATGTSLSLDQYQTESTDTTMLWQLIKRKAVMCNLHKQLPPLRVVGSLGS